MRSALPRALMALLTALLMVSLAACSGDAGDPAGAAPAASGPGGSARGSTQAQAVPGAPSAMMQAGTSSIAGSLIRWCDAGRCTAPDDGSSTYVWLADDDLLLFALSSAPEQARVAIKRQGSSEPVAARALRPGDLMATHAALPRGRYVVTLVAGWPEREATWRFRLRVPAPN